MSELLDDLTRTIGAKIPRRQVFRIFGALLATAVVNRFLPKLHAQVKGCGMDKTGKCVQSGPGVMCSEGCWCPITSPCCGTGGLGVTKCCPTKMECCPGPDAAATCCCIKEREDCDKGTATCVPKPRVELDKFLPGPPAQIEIAVTDLSGRGLSSISVVLAVNAAVDIPVLAPGTTFATVTATRIDPNAPGRVVLQACAFGCIVADPVLTELQVSKSGNRAEDSFSEIPAGEHFITLQNGTPGLRKVQVLVNDKPAATRWLRDKNVRTIDVGSSMKPGPNTITLVANGRPGSSALVLISDIPGPDSGAKIFHPLIAWEPGPVQPGVTLHWGS